MEYNELTKIFDKKNYLCKLCIYSKYLRKSGLICHKTNSRPNFANYCPEYRPYKKKIQAVHSKTDFKKERLYFFKKIDPRIYLYIVSATILSYFSSIIVGLIITIIILTIAGFIIFFIEIDKKDLTKKYGRFPYIYSEIIKYLTDQITITNDLQKILQQQVIKLFGSNYYIDVKDKFKKNHSETNFKELEGKILKLTPLQKQAILSAVCEIYVYNNLKNYNSKGIIEEIAKFLKIDYRKIKDKFARKEIENQKIRNEKRKQLEEKRKRYYQSNTNHRLTKSKRLDYYKILGLSSNVTNDQIKQRIKELALQYHPDRFGNNIELQKQNSEKFKEITEAYNYIKRKRGF